MLASKIARPDGSQSLSTLYQSKIFDDLTIINNGKKYDVHKFILASSCPYFKKMLTTDMMESKSKEITLEHSAEAFEMIIEWIYSQPITLTSDNVRQLAELADYMSIPELIAECLTFLSENSSNSILSEFSYFIDYNGTRRMVERYMCSNFCDIVSTDEFLSYDFETIYDILSFENLNIENELDVFDAIIKWIAADPQHRLDHLGELMKKIHWISVDETQFIYVARNTFVKSCEDSRKVVKAAIDLIAFDELGESKKLELIHIPRRSIQRVSLSFLETEDIVRVFYKSSTSFISLHRNDDLKPPKFFETDSADYNTNSSQVIRIDWENKKFRLFKSDSKLYCCLFGYLFEFETKAPRRVQFWKGTRCITLGKVPDDYSDILSIAPYKGNFYIVRRGNHIYKSSYFGQEFSISKFDPIKNIWTDLSNTPEPQPGGCKKVMMQIIKGKVSLFMGERKENAAKNLFMSSIFAHWIYNINEDSWSVHKVKSDPEIVKKLSNEIQCFENQSELLKSTIAAKEMR